MSSLKYGVLMTIPGAVHRQDYDSDVAPRATDYRMVTPKFVLLVEVLDTVLPPSSYQVSLPPALVHSSLHFCFWLAGSWEPQD
jgi:hypothetical protein